MNAQQARIELLLDTAADELVDEGMISLTTEVSLLREGYIFSNIHAAMDARLSERH